MAVYVSANRRGIIPVKKMLLILASFQIRYVQTTHSICLIKYPPKENKKTQKTQKNPFYFFYIGLLFSMARTSGFKYMSALDYTVL